MKRFTLILLMVLSTVACRKITLEDQIARIAEYSAKNPNTYAEGLQRFEREKRIDYLTLNLAKELKAEDIWTLESLGGNSLVAEYSGKDKKQTQFSLLSASLEDPDACAVVLGALRTIKDLKIKPKGSIRVLFYNPTVDSLGLTGLSTVYRELYESGELVTFEVEVSSLDTLPVHTFRIEEKAAFAEQMMEVIPPYLTPLGDFKFERGRYPNKEWPVKASVYRYHLDPAADLAKESAVVAAFIYLVN